MDDRPRRAWATLFFGLFAFGPRAWAGGGEADCHPGETVIFACTAGTKTIAVCGSPDLSASAGSMLYRYGTADHLELSLPADPATWRENVRSGTMTFAGGGGAWLAFASPPYRYVVFTAIGHGWGNKAGVAVERDGKRIAYQSCTTPATSRIGPDLFDSAGVPADDADFDLP